MDAPHVEVTQARCNDLALVVGVVYDGRTDLEHLRARPLRKSASTTGLGSGG